MNRYFNAIMKIHKEIWGEDSCPMILDGATTHSLKDSTHSKNAVLWIKQSKGTWVTLLTHVSKLIVLDD